MAEISAIIPALNEAKLLPRLLEYLKACDKNQQLEIIVVDGGSNDETPEIAIRFGAKLINSEIKCRAIQMNKGADVATTDNLYFIHADVIPPEDFIEKILEAEKREIQLAFFRQKFDKMNVLLWFNSFFTRFKRLWCRGGDQTIFVKRSLFDRLKGYDERFVIMEEYDFLKRAQKIVDYEILDGETIVSTRKYRTNSWLKVMLANQRAVRQFKKGVEPKKIKESYMNSLNPY